MTEKAVLEFKTAPVIDQIVAIVAIRKLSNKEIVDYINSKTNQKLKPSDWSNIVAGRLGGPAAYKAIQAMREMTGV